MEKVQIAKVAVDLPLPHLDRAFDYLADGPEAADMSVGVRVKVRFAGQLRFGFVLDLVRELPRNGLSPISKVVSPESVLAPSVASLARSVADYYAGTLADVLRLAVPPRHATTEKSNPIEYPKPILGTPPEVLPAYPLGQPYLEALAAGEHPRSAWQIVPSSAALGDWMRGVLEAAEVALASGRGALLLVPDKKTLDALAALAAARFGKGSFVCLSAEAGPAARYRAFLAARRGAVSLVLGTKAAVFAPVENLGLVSIFDDGNDSYAGLRAPYPHTREVAVMRAYQEKASLLIAGYARTAEVSALVAKKWLVPISFSPAQVREQAPSVHTAVNSFTKASALKTSSYRLPSSVFAALRAGISTGPVLVQVPRSGYVPFLACGDCAEPALCPRCSAAVSIHGSKIHCPGCGLSGKDWHCPSCHSNQVRSVVVGVQRTAEEIGRAFPGTKVIISSAEKLVLEVPDEPSLVLATPQAEPKAVGGYAAAVILDADKSLGRAELRVGEESLRRWLAVTALVRPAASQGTVLIVGDAAERTVQALLRLDPVGYSERELAERSAASLPPGVKLVSFTGDEPTLFSALEHLELPAGVTVVGPYPLEYGDAPSSAPPAKDASARLNLISPLDQAADLVAAVKLMLAKRSSRKLPGSFRCQVDPQIVS